MGISIKEFEVAMETLGAERLADRAGSRYEYHVPCFKVKDVEFLHSASNYIVQLGKEAPKDIMDKAMAELGETHPGGDNFWYKAIHSVRGILTLATMLDESYTKALVDELTNKTYKKLLKCGMSQLDKKIPYSKLPNQKMKKLRELILKYDAIVNPFGSNSRLKEPIQYLDKLNIAIGFTKHYLRLDIIKADLSAKFYYNEEGITYETFMLNDEREDQDKGYTSIVHYYKNDTNNEKLALNFTTQDGYDEHPGDVDLIISMKTGLAWRTNQEKQATMLDDKQIDDVIVHLKRTIARLEKTFVCNMIVDK